MSHRTIGRAFAVVGALALVASGSSALAKGSGVHFGTARIASTLGGFSGDPDPRPYDNTGADEVAFGTRGPFPSNYFYLRAGGPRSERFTTAQGKPCEATIFTVTSANAPAWLTDGGSDAVRGKARLLCDLVDGTRLEYRWGYAASRDATAEEVKSAECVVIDPDRTNGSFTFSADSLCKATVATVERGFHAATPPADRVEVPFRVTGNL